MIEEDLTVFLADFGVSITAGAVSGLCLLDMPGEVVFDGVRETYTGALSTMYSITCRTDEFGSLGYGDSVTVDGEVYILQEAPILITDGVFCRINLERVSDAPPWSPGPGSVEIEINGDLP